jgi:TRAP transporter TAXI family solute receptor
MEMRKSRTNGLVLILVLALLAMGMVGCGSKAQDDANQKAPETKFINIATGGTAGTYYPLGGAMAEILKSSIPGVNATAESTGASVANINLLKGGSVDLALVQNDVSYYANNGTELFKDGKVEGLKAIASLYNETCQIVTLKDSGLKSVADFKGKKIAVGAAGSGVEANSRQILAANGLTYEDIKPQYLSFAEAASGLKDGNIDAAFVTAGFPTAAIQDISAQHDVVIIPVTDETADKLIAEYPFYTKVTIPAGTYANQTEDVHSLAVKAMLVATDKMDEATAYEVTKAIFTNLDKLAAAHAVGKEITVENAKEGVSIPMHPGAEKFFNEIK